MGVRAFQHMPVDLDKSDCGKSRFFDSRSIIGPDPDSLVNIGDTSSADRHISLYSARQVSRQCLSAASDQDA